MPLRPRTTGASTSKRLPSGSSRMRSTICWGVCRVMAVPSKGQCGHADAGVEQPEVVVDLGDRADRGARVARGALLVDGDGRREALDEVHVGLVHLAQELAGVGRQRLDVAALALGVDGVEGQRGLARAGQAREDDETVARQLEGDVAEVVLSRPPDGDRVGHRPILPARHNSNTCLSDLFSGRQLDPVYSSTETSSASPGTDCCTRQPGSWLRSAFWSSDTSTARRTPRSARRSA